MWIFDSFDSFAGTSALDAGTELGRRWTRINARDFDPKRRDFAAKSIREGTHTEFPRRIRCDERRGNETRNRGHVDDVTFAALEHVRQNRARNKHGSDQVDANNRFNISFGLEFLEPVHTPKTRIVEKDVDLPVKIERGLHHHVDLGTFGNIHRDGERLPTVILNFSRELLQSFEPARREHNFASFFCKQSCNILAES